MTQLSTALPKAVASRAGDGPESLSAKALAIHRGLCAAYHCPIPYFHDLDPLSELVSSLLSHRTRNAQSGQAFKALRAAYPEWAAVRDAPTAAVETLIAGVTWPELKAPRIQAVLRAVEERTGSLDLGLLAGMGVPQAQAWLEAIPGIGPKTSAAVLSFSTLRMAALPVDSHHHRVAQRTGLVGQRVDVGPSHAVLRAQLPADWDAQTLYDNHEIMMLHGQRCCFHHAPACPRCPILALCPTGSARLAGAPAPAMSGARAPRPVRTAS